MAGNMNRISYFTPTRRDGMFVGIVNEENLDSLISVIKDAKGQGKSIVFFLWRNEPKEGRKSVATLTVAVQQDHRPSVDGPSRRPIGTTAPSAPAKADPLAGLMGGGKSNKGGF